MILSNIVRYENNFPAEDFINKKIEKISKFLRKKTKTIPKPLVTAPEVTQYPDDMEKGDKVGSSIEG